MKNSIGLTGVLAALALTAWLTLGLTTTAQADTEGPADRAPISTPTPVPAPAQPESLSAIRLRAETAPAAAWTVMQWQDALGGWHDVDGWRGEFDPDGYKTWWFPHQHFGTGPFRWQVFASKSGALWGVSAPFYLPDGRDQTLAVTVVRP